MCGNRLVGVRLYVLYLLLEMETNKREVTSYDMFISYCK